MTSGTSAGWPRGSWPGMCPGANYPMSRVPLGRVCRYKWNHDAFVGGLVELHRIRPLPVALAMGLAAAGLTLPAGSASAVSADVVISEVYGGGGNSGATLRNDFIELRNLGSAAVDLTGWSVQYASAAGTTY